MFEFLRVWHITDGVLCCVVMCCIVRSLCWGSCVILCNCMSNELILKLSVLRLQRLSLLPRKANAGSVSYVPYPTGEKHTVPLLIKSIFSLTTQKQQFFFSKLVFQC